MHSVSVKLPHFYLTFTAYFNIILHSQCLSKTDFAFTFSVHSQAEFSWTVKSEIYMSITAPT